MKIVLSMERDGLKLAYKLSSMLKKKNTQYNPIATQKAKNAFYCLL